MCARGARTAQERGRGCGAADPRFWHLEEPPLICAAAAPTNGRSIRVGDEVRTWVEGRCLLFDDSFEHEVWNDADEERLVLIVDVWHPDLKTDDQRKRHLEKELHGAYDHLKTARFWRDTTESGH